MNLKSSTEAALLCDGRALPLHNQRAHRAQLIGGETDNIDSHDRGAASPVRVRPSDACVRQQGGWFNAQQFRCTERDANKRQTGILRVLCPARAASYE